MENLDPTSPKSSNGEDNGEGPSGGSSPPRGNRPLRGNTGLSGLRGGRGTGGAIGQRGGGTTIPFLASEKAGDEDPGDNPGEWANLIETHAWDCFKKGNGDYTESTSFGNLKVLSSKRDLYVRKAPAADIFARINSRTPDDNEYDRCEKKAGPFTTCVIVEDELNGACANCHWQSNGAACSFRRNKEGATRATRNRGKQPASSAAVTKAIKQKKSDYTQRLRELFKQGEYLQDMVDSTVTTVKTLRSNVEGSQTTLAGVVKSLQKQQTNLTEYHDESKALIDEIMEDWDE
ncbi:hypothetical protein N7492_002148 [Penicillium capsulatum]|uniref:Uncharacterized protein n=1 Tax=Penicillium capsulatum TaxID=69766 RepID=A0A9W9IIW8_9EURO|nr:hypothetical protein N7492_002148 [Penicillium capsulatum]